MYAVSPSVLKLIVYIVSLLWFGDIADNALKAFFEWCLNVEIPIVLWVLLMINQHGFQVDNALVITYL